MNAEAHALKDDSYFAHARTEIAPLLPAHAARVLEVGCGNGATLAWLRATGRCERTVGIEIVERAATIARQRADRVVTGDAPAALDTVLGEGPFDLVLCLDVLEHLADPWCFVAQIGTVLQTGATLVASVPNVRHWRVSARLFLLGRWEYADAGVLDRTHLRFFTRHSVRRLFDPAQFDVVCVKPSRPPMGSAGWWAGALSLGLLTDLLAVQMLVSVRRR